MKGVILEEMIVCSVLILRSDAVRASVFGSEVHFADWWSVMDEAFDKSLLDISSVTDNFVMTLPVDRLECLECPFILVH